MTEFDDPWLVDAMWRATDLTRAYLSQNRAQVEACLAGLDTGRLERVLAWLVLDHDEFFDRLGEPSMAVREIDAAAALSPMENEFATTAAVRRVSARETGLAAAVGDLALPEQVHAISVCTVVMALEALGRVRALEEIDAKAVEYERMGYPRPYPVT
ncbi:hypothetical protein [Streptomyces sp. H34-S4]|uniref:hypothetical protein n=1 Tax=Streptomyces sp. H34-S4 TaxID=2996463 RepID=UPI00226D470C|nr:hypothetical protein [Streptomyces sp. H34-S4]MCY0935944.1 hypothetical protein [Streptomyces sp. H34-S4]